MVSDKLASLESEHKALKKGNLLNAAINYYLSIIYIYKRDCLYLCPSFTPEPPDQSPPNFAQTSPPTQGGFLAHAWPHQPDPPDPRVPQTPKDVSSSNLSRAAPGPGWLVYIYKTDCLYLCPLFTPEPPDQSPPNFAQTSPPTWGRFLTQAWPCQPNPWTPGYPKLLNPNGSRERKLCVK